MPKVSVILPTYNREHLLTRSIKSVLNQTFTDLELIIVDDNSTDNTYEVIKEFGDERIKYIRHEKNMGASISRNTGMEASKGEYIAFQDSDDEWVRNKLEVMLAQFENGEKNLGMVFSSIILIQADGRKKRIPSRTKDYSNKNMLNELLFNCITGTPSAMIGRECYLLIGGFDTGFKCFEDYDYFIRIAKRYQVSFISEPLLLAYETIGGVNTPAKNVRAEMQKKILKKHYEDYLKNKSLLAERYFRIGDFYCLDKEYRRGIKYILMAVRLKKYMIPYYIRFVLAVISLQLNNNLYNNIRIPAAKIKDCLNHKVE